MIKLLDLLATVKSGTRVCVTSVYTDDVITWNGDIDEVIVNVVRYHYGEFPVIETLVPKCDGNALGIIVGVGEDCDE